MYSWPQIFGDNLSRKLANIIFLSFNFINELTFFGEKKKGGHMNLYAFRCLKFYLNKILVMLNFYAFY